MQLRRYGCLLLGMTGDPSYFSLLMYRRCGKHHIGRYEFPGGKLNDGEDPVDGVIREVHEETSLRVRSDHLIDLGEVHGEDNSGEQNLWISYYYYLPVNYRTQDTRGVPKIMEPDIHDEILLIPPRKALLNRSFLMVPTAVVGITRLLDHLRI